MAVLSGEIDSESSKIALVKKSTATCYPGLIALVTRYTQRGYRLRRMSPPFPQGEDWGEAYKCRFLKKAPKNMVLE